MADAALIAVTGAAGFLGRHTVRALQEAGHTVVPLTRSDGYDVRRLESLERASEFHTLVHLAALSSVSQSFARSHEYFTTNVMGTINALELCRRREARMVFASSYVYGQPHRMPIDEEHPTDGWNPYASSKLIGEQLCATYARDLGVASTVLRLFNLYGPGQGEGFLIPEILAGLQRGRVLLKTSKPKRDYVFVADVARAIQLCVEADLGGLHTFNVGSGASHSVGEVVACAQQVLARDVPVDYSQDDRVAQVMDMVADCTRIREVLGWTPSWSLAAGLRATAEARECL